MKINYNKNGSFQIDNIDQLSYIYFPLCNKLGLKGNITPQLNGSLNIDQNSFFLTPTSNEDFHNSFMNRNVYFKVNDIVWSITGNTPYQMLHKDTVSVEGDFLIHTLKRENNLLSTKVTSFIGANDNIEYHKVTLTNQSNESVSIKPVLNVPMFSRSAENLRDHRHVTSLLNKATLLENGLVNIPTFVFDESGHYLNNKAYQIQFFTEKTSLKNYWPILEEFIGEGHNLLLPNVVKNDCTNNYSQGDIITGFEITGGFEFHEINLKKNETFELYFALGIDQTNQQLNKTVYNKALEETKIFWQELLNQLTITMKNTAFSSWTKWVVIQPTLRRLFGNSFLPHHDYGKGGRGWRDLWQDQLSLLLMDAKQVRNSLLNSFKGVRIDGSNATIIGDKEGEFKSDRNNIPRVWMDHGSWPFLTTKLYTDKTGDIDFLFEEVSYFNDGFTHYTKKINKPALTDYKGTVLEHLIIQNLVPYFNIGEHHNCRLEDADWNDGLDMAHDKGESIAFTALYGHNLIEIGRLLLTIEELGTSKICLVKALDILFTSQGTSPIERNSMLQSFFDEVSRNNLESKEYTINYLANLFNKFGTQLIHQVRDNEWLSNDTYGYFNSYYDNLGDRIDDVDKSLINLTPQVFSILSNAATDEQTEIIINSVDKLLFDPKVGGYKLNTNYNEVKTNMGRLFGFGYGHKENGAMFTHMAVMYGNALYRRGFVKAGHKVLSTIYDYVSDIKSSKIYPGLPEYVDIRGRGMYPFLTGSASWYLLTLVEEVFGIKGHLGNVLLCPKLVREDFDKGMASVASLVKEKHISFTYHNTKNLDYGEYQIERIYSSNDVEYQFEINQYGTLIINETLDDNIHIDLGLITE